MALTVTGTTVTWNDNTTTTLVPGSGIVSSITTSTGTTTLSTFAVGSMHLVRTHGLFKNDTVGGTNSAFYAINGIAMAYGYNPDVIEPGVARWMNTQAPVLCTSSTVSQDYNSLWYTLSWSGNPTINAPYSYVSGTTTTTLGSYAICSGTWYSRGQLVGRGLNPIQAANFALLQRVA